MSSTATPASRESVLRHRHAREADGVPEPRPAQVQARRGHESEDFVVLKPPKHPKDSKPFLLNFVIDTTWRIYAGVSGIIGLYIMESPEKVVVGMSWI